MLVQLCVITAIYELLIAFMRAFMDLCVHPRVYAQLRDFMREWKILCASARKALYTIDESRSLPDFIYK